MNMSQKKSKSMRTRSPVRLPSLDNTVTSPGSSSKKNQNFSINNYDRNNDGNYNIDYTIKPLPPNSYRSGSYLDDDTVVAPTIGKSPVRTLTETRNPKIKSPKLVNQTTPVKSPIKTPKRPEHNKTTPSSLRKVKKSPGNARDSIDTKKKPLTDIDIMYHNLRVVTEARHSAALANEEDFEPVLHINLQKKLNINDHTSSEGFEGNPEVDFSQVPEDSSSLQEEPFTLATGNVEYGRRYV